MDKKQALKEKEAGARELFSRLLAGKNASRRRKARMPYARKVETVVRLQEIAAAARRAMGQRPARPAWRLPAASKPAPRN